MKKIINKPENTVIEMCKGIVDARPDLKLDTRYKFICRNNLNTDKVILISGGGSGHEPAHAGFVGEGMLDVAVCGDVFASPSTIQIYNAIVASKSQKGTLLIIKNYSGDCMNFDSAAEMAAEDDDVNVAKVYVNDDIAVQDSLYTIGRRGVAGTVLVHKIAGAAAEMGKSLEEVKLIAEKVVKNCKSLGFALNSCTVPAKGTPTFTLGESEMEYGVGIHGEPGIARIQLESSNDLATRTLDKLLAEMKLQENEEVAVMINGLGATPLMELYVLNHDVTSILKDNNVSIFKTYVGNYMTAIDMAGASITLLKVDEELKKYLLAPCFSEAALN